VNRGKGGRHLSNTGRHVPLFEWTGAWYARLSKTHVFIREGFIGLRSRLIVFVSIVQSILFLGHWFLYVTLNAFFGAPASSTGVKIAIGVLSVTFVMASVRAWYSHQPLVRVWYTISAVWLGMASYFLWAGLLCWIVGGASRLLGLGWSPRWIATSLFGAAILASIYGLVNAAWLRVTRVSIAVPNLPEQWRGRVAALVSDTHLGHVRNGRFIRRIVRALARLRPHVVFLAGDLYDGTSGDFEELARPWTELTTPHSPPAVPYGVYYIAGNHEEFYSDAEYHEPLVRAGVRELNNQKVEVDGLQVLGVHYRDATHPERYRQILRDARIDRSRPSVLLLHAPYHMEIAEDEGVSLQLSGHTHGGQFFPYNLVARRVWGEFVHGLQQLGKLSVYISYGAGTWGPPMRVGTFPEIVLIKFE
jgi:predicted MPP superfamily phosphohydrolase